MIQHACVADIVLEAAKEVFETMIFMDLRVCGESDRQIGGEALMATITFTNSVEGCLAICMEKGCAEAVAVNMLGLESASGLAVEEVCDAIGEVANMVMGSVKSRLTDVYHDIQVSIPSVVRGRELVGSLGDNSRRITISADVEDVYRMDMSLLYREAAK